MAVYISYQKYYQQPYLLNLTKTGDMHIQEGNHRNDKYWGFCLKTNKGENNLGKLIMECRTSLRNTIDFLHVMDSEKFKSFGKVITNLTAENSKIQFGNIQLLYLFYRFPLKLQEEIIDNNEQENVFKNTILKYVLENKDFLNKINTMHYV